MSNQDSTATKQGDVYQRVTAQIVTAIEQGVSNWRMPWHTSGRYAFSPINVTSKKPYRGINTVCLWASAHAKGYESGEWTYQQWQDKGAQVRKGEKATTVVFWKFANSAAETDDDNETPKGGSRLLFIRGYSVFNAAQVEGYTPKADADVPMLERIAQAEGFFQNVGATVGTVETKHSTRLPQTIFRCRPFRRSGKAWATIPRLPTNKHTGQPALADVIAN